VKVVLEQLHRAEDFRECSGASKLELVNAFESKVSVAVAWEQFGDSAVGSRYQRTDEGTADWEDAVRAIVTCRLCGLVVRVTGYRSRGPGSIPGATSFSEKYN
jgi:hypothetical protein